MFSVRAQLCVIVSPLSPPPPFFCRKMCVQYLGRRPYPHPLCAYPDACVSIVEVPSFVFAFCVVVCVESLHS